MPPLRSGGILAVEVGDEDVAAPLAPTAPAAK